MFYDKFKSLCDSVGKSCNKVALEIGLSNATPTKWKKTGATPDSSTLSKLSDYFHVSVDYLLGNVSDPFFHLDNQKILRDINSYETEPDLDTQLSSVDFALSGEIHDLTENEKKDVLDFIRFKKSQRGGETK